MQQHAGTVPTATWRVPRQEGFLGPELMRVLKYETLHILVQA